MLFRSGNWYQLLLMYSSDCIYLLFIFIIQVWDLSFESYWSGASCKVTMIGHMHTVRCLQVKRQFSSIYFFFKD